MSRRQEGEMIGKLINPQYSSSIINLTKKFSAPIYKPIKQSNKGKDLHHSDEKAPAIIGNRE
jgi:hypothetical protein